MAEQLANNAASTLTAGIDNVVTSLTVANGTVFPATGTFRIIIDSEIITVGARSGNTLSSLGRGAEATTAASHSSGAAVTHVLTKDGLTGFINSLMPAARVYNSTSSSVANITSTAVTFDSELFDNDTIHDLVTNTSRLTCKTAGIYCAGGQVTWAVNSTGLRYISLRKNGTTVFAESTQVTVPGSSVPQSLTSILGLAVNDYIELVVLQDSGGALNLNALNVTPSLWMARVSF